MDTQRVDLGVVLVVDRRRLTLIIVICSSSRLRISGRARCAIVVCWRLCLVSHQGVEAVVLHTMCVVTGGSDGYMSSGLRSLFWDFRGRSRLLGEWHWLLEKIVFGHV